MRPGRRAGLRNQNYPWQSRCSNATCSESICSFGMRLLWDTPQIWLEELASESNIIQEQEDISSPGKTAGQHPRKQCVRFGRFIIHISGLMCSFGLASCADLEFISLLQCIAAGSSGESMGERLGYFKVREHDVKSADFAIWGQ